MIRDTVNRCRNSPQELAFWMANMSELLHFLKMDKELQKHSQQAQVTVTQPIVTLALIVTLLVACIPSQYRC